jgi:hypothetical protein
MKILGHSLLYLHSTQMVFMTTSFEEDTFTISALKLAMLLFILAQDL